MSMIERGQRWLAHIKAELGVYQRVLRHPRTPWYAKALLGLALAYFVSPIDLIPDPIPVLGQLDDILIVPGLIMLALKVIPPDVVAECRATARDDRDTHRQPER